MGMGKELCDSYPIARETYEEADSVLGFSISRISFNGPEERLRETRNTQPAIFVHSVSAFRVLSQSGLAASIAAGHSLGEYSALAAAGALSFEEALILVQKRGELMHEASLARPGAMAAVLGLSAGAVDDICREASKLGIVHAANLNSPAQLVVSGEVPAVEECIRLARERGAAKAVRLPVSGAFHSPLMESAARGLSEVLRTATVAKAGFPVVANYSAVEVIEPEDIRENLARQVMGVVRWEESMRLMLSKGVKHFVEVGPGSVLKGLMRGIDRQASVASAGKPADMESTLAHFTHRTTEAR
jgi:[acyl-carrier-protein] S-malonyltransferase